MAHDVFVSYSSKDKAVADSIVTALELNGIRCWCAPRDIRPSEDWGKSITSAIEGSRVFLMIFSGNANQSQHVLDELLLAINLQIVILPFRIENLDPEGAMKLHLSSRHWLDAFEPYWESHIKPLVKNVSVILETAFEKQQIVLPGDIARKIKEPKKKISRIISGILISAFLITAGWFGYISLFPQDEENSTSMALGPTSTSTPITPEPALEPTTEPTARATPTLYDFTLELGPPDYETDFLTYGINNGEWPQGLEKEGRSVDIGDDGTLIVDNLDVSYYKKSIKSRMVVDAKFLFITDTYNPAIVLYCIDNPKGSYKARFYLSGEVSVDRASHPSKRLITGKIPPFEIGKFYRLRFDCIGGGFQVFVNGSSVGSGDNFNDETFFSGYPGLSSENAIVVFDNFKLWLP